MQLICDSEQFIGATRTSTGTKLRTWDDGFGPLWLYQSADFLEAIIRAPTEDEAWSIFEDEIADDADMDAPENQPDEDGNLPEGIGYRGGVPASEGLESPLYSYCLNGESFRKLTPADLEERGITLEILADEDEREEITQAVARTAFVAAVADLWDAYRTALDGPNDDDEADLISAVEAWPEDLTDQAAGAGEDWTETVYADTPQSAEDWARRVIADFEKANGRSIVCAAHEWERIAGMDSSEFAHPFAMQTLGHGVGIWDNAPSCHRYEPGTGFDTGHAEFSYIDFL